MGQKVNPISLRLQTTNRHFDSCWYSNYFYKNLLTREIFLQRYLDNFLRLLKLPTGRYSIQHLQKKTQIFNFLCVPRSTRDWRSKVFGLKTKSLKKTKYFFKEKFKRKFKKPTKLNSFYRTVNQLTLYKLQKKITSFQNVQLWSRFFQKPLNKAKNIPQFFNPKQPIKSSSTFLEKNSIIVGQQVDFFLEKKQKHSLPFKLGLLEKNNNSIQKFSSAGTTRSTQLQNRGLSHNFENNHQDLGFFENLLVYKTLKSHLKKTKETNFFEKSLTFRDSPANPATEKKLTKSSIYPLLFSLKAKKSGSSILSSSGSSILSSSGSSILSSSGSSILTSSGSSILTSSGSSILKSSGLMVSNTMTMVETKGIHQKSKLIPIMSLQTTPSPTTSSCSFSNFKLLSDNLNSKNYLESRLTLFYGLEINLMPFKVASDWQHAQYLADEIVFFLQKRVPFRRLKNKLLKELSKLSQIRGVRVTCSGRVGGKSKKAQRAKTECIKYGQTSLQVFSSKIDFSQKTALTSFGSVGVKVWICYN